MRQREIDPLSVSCQMWKMDRFSKIGCSVNSNRKPFVNKSASNKNCSRQGSDGNRSEHQSQQGNRGNRSETQSQQGNKDPNMLPPICN